MNILNPSAINLDSTVPEALSSRHVGDAEDLGVAVSGSAFRWSGLRVKGLGFRVWS